MSEPMEISAELTTPLSRFYRAVAREQPRLDQVSAVDVPQPARELLVHADDMTPTLQGFFGDTIHLRTLNRQQESEIYAREVVLCLDRDDQAVEYGAIEIHYALFPRAAWADIQGERLPLGTILNEHCVAHRCRPGPYFQLQAGDFLQEVLRLESPDILYGRRNQLLRAEGALLADVLEVLPPLSEQDRGA
jgi:chorismate-pyruvate lyase